MRAQGEAKSAELIGEALRQNKGFLELRRLEAAREIANILSTSGNRVLLDSQSLLLNGAVELKFTWFCGANTFSVLGNDASQLLKPTKK